MPRIKGMYILRPDAYAGIYGQEERAAIGELVEIIAPPHSAEEILIHPELLRDVEVILSGWGAPLMDEAFLAHAPRLRAVFYGAGSIRGFVTDALWARDILVTSAQQANSSATAHYALAAILLALKHGWQLAAQVRREQRFPERNDVPGIYQAPVGLLSLGMVGREVRELLRPFGVRVLAYDPFITPAQADALDVTLCSLETLFREALVVSVHTPLLPETTGMIRGSHLASMIGGSTFINTARGGLVREDELIAVLEQRSDLHAVLDVTDPEPPLPASPLYTLPNVTLTPHIAGSLGTEQLRLGQTMVAELRRFLAGEPLKHAITREQAQFMATP